MDKRIALLLLVVTAMFSYAKTREYVNRTPAVESPTEIATQATEHVGYLTKCAPCHSGSEPQAPLIVGKTKEELIESLSAYKTGENRTEPMHSLLQDIDEEKINDLAGEIADL